MHTIDVTRGELRSDVSRQWASRPDDQRFLTLDALHDQVARWGDESRERVLSPLDLRVTTRDQRLAVLLDDAELDLTHYSFGSVARLANVPADYLRRPEVPAPLAAACLRNGLVARAREDAGAQHMAYLRQPGGDDRPYLRGLTSPRYGRIYDADVVRQLQAIAGDGTGRGGYRWKVPGTIEWGARGGTRYNSETAISKETTTLYASDRDVFCFLVDDRNPIEVGLLKNGDPDYLFRGFFVWNSEVGDRTFGVSTMYLRGVCQNRNLWGVEGFQSLTIRHTSGAPDRFLAETAPALAAYAEGATDKVIEGVRAAKAAVVASDDEERETFLRSLGFPAKTARAMIAQSLAEEETAPESAWDMAQAITAYARTVGHQDQRTTIEGVAERLLDKVAA